MSEGADATFSPPKPTRLDIGDSEFDEDSLGSHAQTPLHKRSPMEAPNVQAEPPIRGGIDSQESRPSYKRLSYVHADQLRFNASKAKIKAADAGHKIIHPKDPRKIRWDLYCGVLIVYSVMIIPWRIDRHHLL